MKILSIMYYEFLKNAADKRMLMVWLLTPIIMIAILGNAVDNYFTNDLIDKIPIGYISEDKGVIGEAFHAFLENEEIKERLDIISFNDKTVAEKAVGEGRIDALVYLPDRLSIEVGNGNPQSIMIFGKKNVEFMEGLVKGFISTYNTISSIISVEGNPVEFGSEKNIERIFYSTKETKTPRSLDYYSVLTLLQVLIMGAILGVYIVSKPDDSDMHIRVHALPINKWTLIGGRILGSVSFLLMISAMVMLVTKYLYKTNWDGNFLIIFGALLVFCTIVVGIGILVGALIRSNSVALMIVLLMMMFFGTISGAVSPATTGGIGFLSPNFHTKILIFGTIYDYPKQVMTEAAIWLGGFLIAIYGLLVVMVRRLRYDNI